LRKHAGTRWSTTAKRPADCEEEILLNAGEQGNCWPPDTETSCKEGALKLCKETGVQSTGTGIGMKMESGIP